MGGGGGAMDAGENESIVKKETVSTAVRRRIPYLCIAISTRVNSVVYHVYRFSPRGSASSSPLPSANPYAYVL